MADITGEPWGAGFNGYAVLDQTAVGIQRRQYARAFIFADDAQPNNRVVHVTADIGLMFQSIHLEVLRRLRQRFGSLYGEHNVLIAATHTHVAPGGTSQHLMVDLTTSGFRPKTFEATVKGLWMPLRGRTMMCLRLMSPSRNLRSPMRGGIVPVQPGRRIRWKTNKLTPLEWTSEV